MFCLCNADGEGGCACKICHLGRDVHCVHVRLCHIHSYVPAISCFFLFRVHFFGMSTYLGWVSSFSGWFLLYSKKAARCVCVFCIVDGFLFSTLFEYQRLVVFKMNVEGLHSWIFLRDVKRQNMPHSFI